jgi:tripartite-type tricarboxylate transporter receptor subunit TctC
MAKRLAGLLLVLAGVVCGAGSVSAQTWPSKPIHWISPWAPGGGNDVLSRSIAAEISKTLGQPVIVDNRPGASGVIGTDQVAKAAPDGYTLTLGAPVTHATAPSMFPDLPYDPVRDFTPITLVGTVASVLVVHPSVPAKTVPELIAYLKANPGKANYSSVGNGSMQHLSAEMFRQFANVDMVHVPYKGTSPALVDLTAGRIQLAFETMPAVLPLVRTRQIRAIAVTTPKRSNLLPDVPTLNEAGLKGFDSTIWYAVFGPAGMKADVINKLNQAIVSALKTPDVAKRLSDLGTDIAASTPEELGKFEREQVTKWTAFIKERGIQPN